MHREYDLLQSSIVYGLLYNGVIIGFYSFFSLGIPGMTWFYNTDYLFLISGLIILCVFLNMQIEYDQNVDVTRCSKFTGSLIIGLCVLPSLLLLIIFYLLPIILGRYSPFPTDNPQILVCFLLQLIFIILGIRMGLMSFRALKRCSKPTITSAYRLKQRGIQVGVILLAIGCIFTGITLTYGQVGYSEITYELSIEATKPTTYYFPLPMINQDDILLSVIDELSIVSGSGTWTLNDTEYGKALMVHTTTGCQLVSRKGSGLKDRNQVDTWYETSSLTMKEGEADNGAVPVFMYASTNNSTIDFRVSLHDNLGTSLDYIVYNEKLQQGWQVVTVDRLMATI